MGFRGIYSLQILNDIFPSNKHIFDINNYVYSNLEKFHLLSPRKNLLILGNARFATFFQEYIFKFFKLQIKFIALWPNYLLKPGVSLFPKNQPKLYVPLPLNVNREDKKILLFGQE